MRARNIVLVAAAGVAMLAAPDGPEGPRAQSPPPALTGQVSAPEAGALERWCAQKAGRSHHGRQRPKTVLQLPGRKARARHHALRIRAQGYEPTPRRPDVSSGSPRASI
jgi:hypothetical protein